MRERERERERERDGCGMPMCCTIKEMNDTENLFIDSMNLTSLQAKLSSKKDQKIPWLTAI